LTSSLQNKLTLMQRNYCAIIAGSLIRLFMHSTSLNIDSSKLGCHSSIVISRFISAIGFEATCLSAKELESRLFLPKWLIEKGITKLISQGILTKEFLSSGIRGKRSLQISTSTHDKLVSTEASKWPFEDQLYNELWGAAFDGQLNVTATTDMLKRHYNSRTSREVAEEAHDFFSSLSSTDKYKMIHLFCSMFSHTDNAFVVEAGYSRLGKISGLSRSQVRRYIDQLVKHKLVIRVYQHQHPHSSRLGFSASSYQINIAHPALISCPSFPVFSYHLFEASCVKPYQLKFQLERILPSVSLEFDSFFDDRIVESACSLNLSITHGLSEPTHIYPLANKELYAITKSLIKRLSLSEGKEPFSVSNALRFIESLKPKKVTEKPYANIGYEHLKELKLDVSNPAHQDVIKLRSIMKEVRFVLKHSQLIPEMVWHKADNFDNPIFDWTTFCFSIAAAMARANPIQDVDIVSSLNNQQRRAATCLLPADYSYHREHTLFVIPLPENGNFRLKRPIL